MRSLSGALVAFIRPKYIDNRTKNRKSDLTDAYCFSNKNIKNNINDTKGMTGNSSKGIKLTASNSTISVFNI